MRKIGLALAVLAFGSALWAQSTSFDVATVSAHGKGLKLEVSSLRSGPDNPLLRLFRVAVFYADGDIVDEAKVQLSSVRQGGGPVMESAIL